MSTLVTLSMEELSALIRQEMAAVLEPSPEPLAVQSTGWIVDVVPDTPILSDWGNSIRNRTVTVFTDKAQRDAQAPASNLNIPLGSYCVTLDTGSLWELNDKTSVRRWTPSWATAWGTVAGGSAVSSTVVSSITGIINVPGIDVTVVHPPNRRLRATLCLQGVANTVAGAGASVWLWQDGTQVHGSGFAFPLAGIGSQILIEKDVVVPASGSTRLLAQISSYAAGAASIHVTGQFTGPSFLATYDIGPATPIPA